MGVCLTIIQRNRAEYRPILSITNTVLFIRYPLYLYVKPKNTNVQLTFLKTSFPRGTDLFLIQGNTVNLHAGDFPAESPSITNSRAHPDRIISSQIKSSDTLSCYRLGIQPQCGDASIVIVSGANVIPGAITRLLRVSSH